MAASDIVFDCFAGTWTAGEAKDFDASIRSLEQVDEELLEVKRLLDTSAYVGFKRGHPEM